MVQIPDIKIARFGKTRSTLCVFCLRLRTKAFSADNSKYCHEDDTNVSQNAAGIL